MIYPVTQCYVLAVAAVMLVVAGWAVFGLGVVTLLIAAWAVRRVLKVARLIAAPMGWRHAE